MPVFYRACQWHPGNGAVIGANALLHTSLSRPILSAWEKERAMQSQNRFFDDLAKVAGGALGALSGLKQEMEAMVRERVERFMADNNMVPREEFEAVKAMAAEARAEQERLAARVAALEAALAKK